MRIKTMAFLIAAGLIAVAPQAYAMGGGGGGGGGDVSGSGTFKGTVSGNNAQGTWTDANGNSGTYDGTVTSDGPNGLTPTTSAAEPLSLLAVGAGLLGARYLRRR